MCCACDKAKSHFAGTLCSHIHSYAHRAQSHSAFITFTSNMLFSLVLFAFSFFMNIWLWLWSHLRIHCVHSIKPRPNESIPRWVRYCMIVYCVFILTLLLLGTELVIEMIRKQWSSSSECVCEIEINNSVSFQFQFPFRTNMDWNEIHYMLEIKCLDFTCAYTINQNPFDPKAQTLFYPIGESVYWNCWTFLFWSANNGFEHPNKEDESE